MCPGLVSWAATSAVRQRPTDQKDPMLGYDSERALQRNSHILLVNLYFVNEVQWDPGVYTRDLRAYFLASLDVFCYQLPGALDPAWPPSPHPHPLITMAAFYPEQQ